MTESAKAVQNPFFEVRLNSLPPGIPLPCDVFLMVNGKPTLLRKMGEVLTPDRIKQLAGHGRIQLLVPNDQLKLYRSGLRSVVKDPGHTTETKAKILKETAFIHVHDLFTKQDITPVVEDAKELVQDMIQLVSTDVSAVSSLMKLSAHDYYTYNHSVNAAVYSIVLAKKLFGEDKQIQLMAGLGGFLHDIGKKKIDWNLINKAGALSAKEWEEIKRHPTYGKEFLDRIPSIPKEAKNIVHQHHECFDGKGYPNQLRGDEISKLARVVSIADVFDALTTERSYHRAMTPQEAIDKMFGMQPGKFDPSMFKAFNTKFRTKSDVVLPPEYDPCAPQAILQPTDPKSKK